MYGYQLIELEENDWGFWSQAKNSNCPTESRQLSRSEAWFSTDVGEGSLGKKIYISKIWGRNWEEVVSPLPLPWCPFTSGGPVAGGPGAPWPPAVQGRLLPPLPEALSLERTRKDILLPLLCVTRFPPHGQVDACTFHQKWGDHYHPSSPFHLKMALTFQCSLQCQLHLTPQRAVFLEFHLVIQLPNSLPERVFLKSTLLKF